jgi:hypothetical protein
LTPESTSFDVFKRRKLIANFPENQNSTVSEDLPKEEMVATASFI